MADLFLIAHKVRGEPAFDIATQMACPLCAGHGHDLDGICHECDSLGYWWIIPTSGHRAYPWWHGSLESLGIDRLADWNWGAGRTDNGTYRHIIPGTPNPDVPDHYATRAAPTLDLATLLGFNKPKAPPTPFLRRM